MLQLYIMPVEDRMKIYNVLAVVVVMAEADWYGAFL